LHGELFKVDHLNYVATEEVSWEPVDMMTGIKCEDGRRVIHMLLEEYLRAVGIDGVTGADLERFPVILKYYLITYTTIITHAI